MPLVRVRAEQTVRYDQILDITEAELKEIRADANSGARKRQQRAMEALADSLNVSNVSDADEIDWEEVVAEVVDADGKLIEEL